MKERDYEILKYYLGIEFIKYVINKDEMDFNKKYEDNLFNKNQVEILNSLFDDLEYYRIDYIKSGGYGDGAISNLKRHYSTKYPSIYNHYREVCNGSFPNLVGNDSLVNFLSNICIREYPKFLIKPISTDSPFDSIDSCSISTKESDEIVELIKLDDIGKLTNNLEGLSCAFNFLTIDRGIEREGLQIAVLPSIIIKRAFDNSCYKMNFKLDEVLNELRRLVEELRELSNNKTTKYSLFAGIMGVVSDDFDELGLGEHILRMIIEDSNPSVTVKKTIINMSSENRTIPTGAIFEIKKDTFLNNDLSLSSEEYGKYQSDIIDKLLFSIIFSTFATNGPKISFVDNGFPLSTGSFNWRNDFFYPQILKITKEQSEKVVEWFNLLSDIDIKSIVTPLNRLKYSLFERIKPEDSIVDAIIAWEGMFSEAFETSFKVTGSISKFLREPEERPNFHKRLKALYNLRSELVHGKKSNLLTEQNVYDIRTEVLNITIECLIKLLKNPKLLKMEPAQRVNQVLVLD